ncbi:MAG: hypothetical protein ACYTBJ_00415 [Planctomycetota bacterium]|jgi:hypothetical protein
MLNYLGGVRVLMERVGNHYVRLFFEWLRDKQGFKLPADQSEVDEIFDAWANYQQHLRSKISDAIGQYLRQAIKDTEPSGNDARVE